ncbi:MAG: hypothetical protein QMB99_04565 [Paludibacteraceae bacterium]
MWQTRLKDIQHPSLLNLHHSVPVGDGMIKYGLVIPMRSEESNFNSLFCHTHSPVGKGIMKKTALLFLS